MSAETTFMDMDHQCHSIICCSWLQNEN